MASGQTLVGAIVGAVIALAVAAAILPQALIDISNETLYTGANSAVITMVTVALPIVAVAGLLLLFLRRK